MSQSPHLGLSFLAPAQAQKHVTVNETFRRLGALVQLGVLDRTLSAPPSTPAEGDRHIVAAAPTGAWAGHASEIAAFLDGTWVFVEPKPGWLAYVAAEGALLVFVGGAWVGAMGALASLDNLGRLGIAATADATNRLAVSSPAALFNHAGAGVQVKLNKASAADNASLLFQRAFSGRAEFGLAGSDAFSLKVSPDGSSWTTALSVDPASGAVDMAQTPSVQVDKFAASGVWTKPAWARRVRAILISGGAGGGSGALRTAGVAAGGGSGGATGQAVELEFSAADLSATVAVTVGADGAGGAARTTANADGQAGGLGGDTSFGSYAKAAPLAAADAIHPNDAGHDVIAQAVADARLQVRTAYVYDSFAGADGDSLTAHAGEIGASWTLAFGYAPGVPAPQIVSNRLYNTALSSVYAASGQPGSADYEVIATLYCVSVLAGENVGVFGRGLATVSDARYWARYMQGTGWQLYKTAGGTSTQLGATSTASPMTAGVARRLMLRMVGSAISLWVDGAQLVAVTDTDIAVAGFSGLRLATAKTATTGIHVEDLLVRPVAPLAGS